MATERSSVGSSAGSSASPRGGRGRLLAVGECMIEMAALAEPGTYRMGFAGDTFNTAWYARRLLPEGFDVGYITAVGTDDASASMLAFMRNAGIGTEHVARVPDRTVGLYTIALRDGERSFSYWRSHSAARLLARHLPEPRFVGGEGTVLHVSGITLAILPPDDRAQLIAWLGEARAAGATVSFDPNVRPALWEGPDAIREWVERAARVADIVLPSLDEEARDFGEGDAVAVAARYLGWGADAVVVKNGDAPGLIATAGWREPYACEPVRRVVDTTAAGDSFDAGLLAARMRGEGLVDSVRAGARLAAHVVQHRGALVPIGA